MGSRIGRIEDVGDSKIKNARKPYEARGKRLRKIQQAATSATSTINPTIAPRSTMLCENGKSQSAVKPNGRKNSRIYTKRTRNSVNRYSYQVRSFKPKPAVVAFVSNGKKRTT